MKKYSIAVIAVIAVLSLLVGATSQAEEPNEVTITASFEDSDVKDVLAHIASAGKVNVIVSPRVTGTITIRFEARSVRAALDQVASRVGAHVAEEPYGILRVIPQADVRLVEDRWEFSHWTPGGAVPEAEDAPLFRVVIDRLVRREGGSWRYGAKGRRLTLTAAQATGAMIKAILSEVDRAPTGK